MVIGHDYIDAVFGCKSNLVACRNAAVNGNDQIHGVGSKAFNSSLVQSIPFADAFGNIVIDIAAVLSQV